MSMDWEKINEEHKVENRDEFNKKLVDRMCQLWKQEMGCDANSAMVHKWVVDKGYERPGPAFNPMLKYYQTAIAELRGKE